jgi:hypothetical protein
MLLRERRVVVRELEAKDEILDWADSRVGLVVHIGVNGRMYLGRVVDCDREHEVITLLCVEDAGDC